MSPSRELLSQNAAKPVPSMHLQRMTHARCALPLRMPPPPSRSRDAARAQVSMESNGKGVDINGERLRYKAGEVDFGEPGTNGQHSFYQLIHQGRVVPCEFIGVIRSQQSVYLKGEIVSNHDELMCNFFAQVRHCGLGGGHRSDWVRHQDIRYSSRHHCRIGCA